LADLGIKALALPITYDVDAEEEVG